MRGRSRGLSFWLWLLWLSVATPLAAVGCLVACGRASETLVCCPGEASSPCSSQPCSCAPCPVCSAPAPQPLIAEARPLSVSIQAEDALVETLELPCAATISTPLPEPSFSFPNDRAPRAHPSRAPPVLSGG